MQLITEWRQVFAALSASISLMMAGASYGWTTVVLDELLSHNSPVPMTLEESSWMVSIINLGQLMACMTSSIAADIWGRKWTLLSSAPLTFFSWIAVLFTNSVWVLYGVRIIQGITCGIVLTLFPLYASEISGPQLRGALSSLYALVSCLGILYEYIFGAFLSYNNLIYVTLVLPVLFISTFTFMPESPYYLLIKGNRQAAEKALKQLRSGPVSEELAVIEAAMKQENENKLTWKIFLADSKVFKILVIVSILNIVKFMSGSVAIYCFANQIFESTTDSFLDPSEYSICLGTIMVLSSIVLFGLVDSIGRRPLLLISAVGSAISLTCSAIFYYLAQESIYLSNATYIPFLTISAYYVFFSLGLNPIVPTIQAELFSTQVRSIASGIVITISTIAIFVVMKTYQTITDRIGIYFNFVIYAIFCYVGIVFIYIFVPETKNKTLVEIQNNIRNS